MTAEGRTRFSQFRIRSLLMGTTTIAAGLSLSNSNFAEEFLLVGIPLCLFLPLATWTMAILLRSRHPALPDRMYIGVAWLTLAVVSASWRYIMSEPFVSLIIVLNFWLPQVAWVLCFEWCEREQS